MYLVFLMVFNDPGVSGGFKQSAAAEHMLPTKYVVVCNSATESKLDCASDNLLECVVHPSNLDSQGLVF
jgi:hypothetical protein